MKLIITAYFLIITYLTGFAQNKKIGLTAQVSNPIRDTQVGWFDIDNESFDNYNVKDKSYALGLFGSYKVKESIVRLRFNYTKINIEEYHDLYQTGTKDFTSVKGLQNKITIAPGITWILNNNKLDLYFGFELPLTLHGKYKLVSEIILSDSASGSILSSYYGTAEIPKGYSIGIGGIGGFNYFIHPNLSVGAEYSPSLLYAKLGGQTRGEYGYTTEDALEGFTFFEQRFSIGISIWF